MGDWFGIIFKILIPLVALYRPIKSFSFSIVLIGLYYGTDAPSLNTFAIVTFVLVYLILLAMTIWFPKAASVIEFFLIAFYLGFLGLLFVGGFFSSYIAALSPYLWTYIFELPLVLLFLTGKIIFYFFIRSKRKEILQQERHDQLLYDSDSSGYLF